jgi:hypothetical protein
VASKKKRQSFGIVWGDPKKVLKAKKKKQIVRVATSKRKKRNP